MFPDGGLPTADDLAGLTGGRPVLFVSYDAHTIWLNRPAMKRVGITPETEEVTFGELVLDRQGRPTGILKGTMGLTDEAEESLWQFVPNRDAEGRYASLKQNLSDAVRYGITTIVERQASVRRLSMYKKALEEGHLFPGSEETRSMLPTHSMRLSSGWTHKAFSFSFTPSVTEEFESRSTLWNTRAAPTDHETAVTSLCTWSSCLQKTFRASRGST